MKKIIMSVMAILAVAASVWAADATYVSSGAQVDYTPSADVAAGDIVIQAGRLIGVANTAIASNDLGSITVVGVYDIVQAAEVIAAGTPVYWDDNGSPYGGVALSGAATATSTANTFIGFALAASAVDDSTVRVVLNSSIVSASSAVSFTAGTLAVQTNATVGGTLAVTGVGTFTAESVHNGGIDADYITADAGYGIDVKSAGTVMVGESTVTKVEIGDTGVETEIQGTLDVLGDVDINEQITVDLDAADEEIVVTQSSAAGTASTPLMLINDDRTGATANEKAEASISIDAEGVYGIAINDGALWVEGVAELGGATTITGAATFAADVTATNATALFNTVGVDDGAGVNGAFSIYSTTQLVFIAGSVTNIVDSDITN